MYVSSARRSFHLIAERDSFPAGERTYLFPSLFSTSYHCAVASFQVSLVFQDAIVTIGLLGVGFIRPAPLSLTKLLRRLFG